MLPLLVLHLLLILRPFLQLLSPPLLGCPQPLQRGHLIQQLQLRQEVHVGIHRFYRERGGEGCPSGKRCPTTGPLDRSRLLLYQHLEAELGRVHRNVQWQYGGNLKWGGKCEGSSLIIPCRQATKTSPLENVTGNTYHLKRQLTSLRLKCLVAVTGLCDSTLHSLQTPGQNPPDQAVVSVCNSLMSIVQGSPLLWEQESLNEQRPSTVFDIIPQTTRKRFKNWNTSFPPAGPFQRNHRPSLQASPAPQPGLCCAAAHQQLPSRSISAWAAKHGAEGTESAVAEPRAATDTRRGHPSTNNPEPGDAWGYPSGVLRPGRFSQRSSTHQEHRLHSSTSSISPFSAQR